MKKSKTRTLHICQCPACTEHPASRLAQEHRAINRVLAGLDEKSRRRFAGLLALQGGWGSVQRVHEITGLSRTTIRAGQAELGGTERGAGVRRAGGGRVAIEKNVRAF